MSIIKNGNQTILEVEDELLVSPEKTKKVYNKNFAMTAQFNDNYSSFSFIDQVDEADQQNPNQNAFADEQSDQEGEDSGFFMRGKSSTISKCSDIETIQSVRSITSKRPSFFLQQRIQLQIPSFKKLECAASKEEIQFTSKYVVGKKLGEGANAVVKACYQKDESGEPEKCQSKLYAVKIFKTNSIEQILEIQRECQIMQQINHPSIIKFKELIIEKSTNKAYLVQEFAQGKSLQSYLTENCQNRQMDEVTALSIVLQVLRGLCSLHSRNICHFDIKPDNIIYNQNNGKIKIIDFSSSRKSYPNQKLLTNIGTLNYKSPEYFGGSQRNTKSDIWSVGVILYQLLTGFLPFDDLSGNPCSITENIKNMKFQQQYKEVISPKMLEILELMLVFDPSKRYSANQLLQKIPYQTELYSLKQLKSNRKPAQQTKNSTFKSNQNFENSLQRISTTQTFLDIVMSPELCQSRTDRYLKIHSSQIEDFKNILSINLDNIVI
ncbi:dual-specificity kinase domain protein (macronuclear) [Tetrahymena thermophila SB210]|uniref:Dual-specificity kinase domain protein n=1 Tax=Tetrahymena thermophila (strain SB210) TaxID=312017 RepID=I7MKS7_TETTS|nr:dual-specificity kinase domain protein [Tetrahymena thermophila SB210]EAS00235.1 dual-specificity kinase domain protein [Tetrahymena thermophila SB210]|eukprot:XP_001020480.1 dual-specificity kinase domain protein [Tetrahymena thermophila SB210]